MSASLVGSEMCIRDRPFGQEVAGEPPLQAPLQGGYRPPGSPWLAPPARACLLYTSDAADDM
eukprot:5697199-Alexandrium_andersonii.AAC.1